MSREGDEMPVCSNAAGSPFEVQVAGWRWDGSRGQTHGAREEGSSDHPKKAGIKTMRTGNLMNLRLTSIASPNNDACRLRARSTQPPRDAFSALPPRHPFRQIVKARQSGCPCLLSTVIFHSLQDIEKSSNVLMMEIVHLLDEVGLLAN